MHPGALMQVSLLTYGMLAAVRWTWHHNRWASMSPQVP